MPWVSQRASPPGGLKGRESSRLTDPQTGAGVTGVMAQFLSKIYVHLIFSTKDRERTAAGARSLRASFGRRDSVHSR